MQDFADGKIIVFTSNEEEAMGFLKECEKVGLLWSDGKKPTNPLAWWSDPRVFRGQNGLKYERNSWNGDGLTYGHQFDEENEGCENVMIDDLIIGKHFEVRLPGIEHT